MIFRSNREKLIKDTMIALGKVVETICSMSTHIGFIDKKYEEEVKNLRMRIEALEEVSRRDRLN